MKPKISFLPRREVHLPSALEMSKADQSCLNSGAPDYIAFLAKFYAKQLAELNTRKARVRFALTRWDTDPDTIPYQKRTSEMIRCIGICLHYHSCLSFSSEMGTLMRLRT